MRPLLSLLPCKSAGLAPSASRQTPTKARRDDEQEPGRPLDGGVAAAARLPSGLALRARGRSHAPVAPCDALRGCEAAAWRAGPPLPSSYFQPQPQPSPSPEERHARTSALVSQPQPSPSSQSERLGSTTQDDADAGEEDEEEEEEAAALDEELETPVTEGVDETLENPFLSGAGAAGDASQQLSGLTDTLKDPSLVREALKELQANPTLSL